MPKPTPARKRPTLLIVIIALIAIVALVFLGSRLYANTVSNEAEEAPTLSSSSAAAATNADGSWTAADGSYAGYRLDEVLNGSNVTVTGRTEEVDAHLTVTDSALTDATATIQVAGITTDSDRRDEYFRTSAIDTNTYPEATFTLTEPADLSNALDSGSGPVTFNGELSINGQTQPITVEADSAFGDGTAQVVGQIPVTWADFGVEAPNLGFVSVEDTGFIEFSLNLAQD